MTNNGRIVQQVNTSVNGMVNALNLIKQPTTAFPRQKKFFINKLFSLFLQSREFNYCYIMLDSYNVLRYREAVEGFKDELESLFEIYNDLQNIDDRESFVIEVEDFVDSLSQHWKTIYRAIVTDKMTFYCRWGKDVSNSDRGDNKTFDNNVIDEFWNHVQIPNREINIVVFNTHFRRSNFAELFFSEHAKNDILKIKQNKIHLFLHSSSVYFNGKYFEDSGFENLKRVNTMIKLGAAYS